MSEQMKPDNCPFCGVPGKVATGAAAVYCRNPECLVRPAVTGFTIELAIAAWNRRSPIAEGMAGVSLAMVEAFQTKYAELADKNNWLDRGSVPSFDSVRDLLEAAMLAASTKEG